MNTFHALIALAAATALQAAAATPADTTVLIDQATANAAGFPLKLNQPGQYKLMSNLVVPAGKNAIQVLSSDVTLDLNGFTIQSDGVCAGAISGVSAVVSCSGGGAYGVYIQSPTDGTLALRNGHLRGFQYCAAGSMQASDLTLSHCMTGITAAEGSLLERVRILNSGTGIVANGASVRAALLWTVGTGIQTYGGLIDGVTVHGASLGIEHPYGLGGVRLRGSVINAAVPTSGLGMTGYSLCNGATC